MFLQCLAHVWVCFLKRLSVSGCVPIHVCFRISLHVSGYMHMCVGVSLHVYECVVHQGVFVTIPSPSAHVSEGGAVLGCLESSKQSPRAEGWA